MDSTAPTEPAHRGRNLLRELAGGVGDWGLLIPLAVALIALNGLDATVVFVGVGLTYVATALAFRVPVPVQPLKAFAAAAIALELSAETLAAGALLMAAVMAVLAVTGLANWLAARFPQVLVRGIQAAVALLLAKAAIELARDGNWEGLPTIEPWVGVAMAVAACAVLFVSAIARVPGSLLVLGAGVGIGLAVSGLPEVALGAGTPSVSFPGGDAFATALTALVLAQIPLTFGNSIVATADAEREYFGQQARRVTPRRLAASIGGANLFAGLFSGLPVCHGAGGVTAHYKLGARTWIATAMAGSILIVLGLLFGSSLPALLQLVPPGALAGMLMFVAIQHGLLAARLETTTDRLIAVTVGVVTLLAGNLAWGFAAGVVLLVTRAAVRSSRSNARGRFAY
jgi:MFS superfamily sulfate permease-like transporter